MSSLVELQLFCPHLPKNVKLQERKLGAKRPFKYKMIVTDVASGTYTIFCLTHKITKAERIYHDQIDLLIAKRPI